MNLFVIYWYVKTGLNFVFGGHPKIPGFQFLRISNNEMTEWRITQLGTTTAGFKLGLSNGM